METYDKQSVQCAVLSVQYLPLNYVQSKGRIWKEFEIGWDFSAGEIGALIIVLAIVKGRGNFVNIGAIWRVLRNSV